MLYLVPSPIGNLEDITFRAINVLKEVSLILAEDTRTSAILLKHYQVETKTIAFHSFNEHAKTKSIIDQLANGTSIALLSDAGTPGISDPGFLLTRACWEAGIKVVALPGPTALIPALVASGIPSDKFFFEGFLPHKKGRLTRLQFLSSLPHTFILYESPHRLIKTLQQLIECCGESRTAAVARELSKIHEEIINNTLDQLLHHFSSVDKIRGEIVIIVSGNKS